MKKANRDEGQNISALHPYLKCFFDKSLILYTYENPCELASSVDYPRSRIPQIFPSNKALKNFYRKKVKKKTVFLSKTVFLVARCTKKDIRCTDILFQNSFKKSFDLLLHFFALEIMDIVSAIKENNLSLILLCKFFLDRNPKVSNFCSI